MSPVRFVDTCILTNVLDLNGFNQHREAVAAELKKKVAGGETLILPVTAVIETGRHIAHHGNGAHRRQAAEKFSRLLLQIRHGVAPWRFHAVRWDADFPTQLLEGAGTGSSPVANAMAGMGCGDLRVLAEREAYRKNSGLGDVRVWSLDDHLSAYG